MARAVLTGPRGEGLFGITFGIKGSMERPQVIVNPLSLITPGIFRRSLPDGARGPPHHPRERPAAPRRTARAPQCTGGDPAGSRVPSCRERRRRWWRLVGGSGSAAPAQAPLEHFGALRDGPDRSLGRIARTTISPHD